MYLLLPQILMEICLFSCLRKYVDEAARSKSFGIERCIEYIWWCMQHIYYGGAFTRTKLFELLFCFVLSIRRCLHYFLPRFEYDRAVALAFKNNFYSLFMFFIDFIATDLKTIPGVLEIFDDKLTLLFLYVSKNLVVASFQDGNDVNLIVLNYVVL